jgi:hypothetical protein|tara:strand:+ start:420 stop:1052 length:633 start_codon:yes stop_codon:yes gene_type:complete
MNYASLKTNIKEIAEHSFSDDQLALFTQQAEQKIYNIVQLPAIRRNVAGTLTNANQYLAIPPDFLYSYSLSVTDTDGNVNYLIQKDQNFIREAYPKSATTGFPKHYAYFSDEYIIIGPTPNSNHTTDLHYGYYPESIVTAGTTPWLGAEFDSALLNGALIEAARFMKAEPDIVTLYDKEFAQSIQLLKNLSDGKLRQDAYRSGQYSIKPK